MIAALFNQMNQPEGARREYEQAAAMYDALPNPGPFELYNMACVHARLGSLMPDSYDQARPSEPYVKQSHFDRAIVYLRKAVTGGYRQFSVLSRDADLDPLRPRADFQLLMQDAAFPLNPFAR